MMMILILIIVVLLFLLLRRNNGSRNTYNYPRPEPPTYGGSGMGRGLGMFAGGLAAGALLSYLWEQGRLSEDQYHYFNSLDDEEAIRQLQEQNLLQADEVDDLRNRMNNDEPSQYDQADYDNDYDDDSDDGFDGGSDDDGFI